MSTKMDPTPDPLTPTRAGSIDVACDRFEVQWRAGRRPRIEDFLNQPGAAEAGPILLRELLALELRARAGERPGREEYAARFPGDTPAVAAAFRAVRPHLAAAATRSPGTVATVEPTPTGPAPDAGSGEPTPSADQAAGEGLGSVIERYKILEEIGRGGMGTVFLTERLHPVRRRVALKVIKPGMDSEQVVARFEAERQALALMDHPTIAKVLDAGTTQTGRPFFVMELVEGSPITQYCDRHQLGIRPRLELFAAVSRAVQHAHQKGIIHRDLKPSNILVALQDGRPTPKVIDFGIAKAIDQRLTERTLFTHLGQIVGTPE
jgi:tRNA A-37 threonylcarbamoyl transferase component Bud32